MTDSHWSYTQSQGVAEELVSLGAEHITIRPHCPWRNGKVERSNRTLHIEWAYRQVFTSHQQRSDVLPARLDYYNDQRRHSSLGGRPPDQPTVTNLMAEYNQQAVRTAGAEEGEAEMFQTDSYEGLLAETVVVTGAGGDLIHAYHARPLGPGPFPGVVLFHHRPGWDAWYRATTRLFAAHGYGAISPDLYCRFGHGEPDDVAAKARAEGGAVDDQVVEDAEGCMRHLRAHPSSNGKIGLFGTCSGGRHAYLTACRLDGIAAVVDCWGGNIVVGDDALTAAQPVAPADLSEDLDAPVLGLFGDEDRNPTRADVDALEEILRRLGKPYEFHRYPEAGHGFFYHDRPSAYRAEAAVDGWSKVWSFLARHLS
jgi:carboxymethylenebutenolidase